MPSLLHPQYLFTLARRNMRRAWLNYGFFWFGAVLVGLLAVLFARWANQAQDEFVHVIAGRAWLALLITPTLTALCVWLTRRFFVGSEGSGIPQVIAAMHAPKRRQLIPGLFGLRIIVGKIGVGLLGLAAGLTIGREGPTVHIGASIMYEMRRFYPRVSPQLERSLLLAGAAAGLSGAFNTPLAGVVFAIEEIARSFESRTNGTLITAIVVSGLVSVALAGNYLYFGQISSAITPHASFVFPVIFAAILCGAAGGVFNLLVLRQKRWIPQRLLDIRASRPLVWGAGLGLLIAVVGIASGGDTWGSGYDQARALLMEQKETVGYFYPLAKLGTMVLTYMAGTPAGLFSPSLSIGAGFGHVASALFPGASASAVVAVCMVGYLAAVTQSPLTSFIIVMEMINGSSLLIPLMATALISSRVANFFTPPLYDALAHQNYGSVSEDAAAPGDEDVPANEDAVLAAEDAALPDRADDAGESQDR
ncbi:MAG: chloride channel protein [Burkholderiales bacterium]|nr:chloride channel protein [Burkholderiales bacterium]